MSDNFETSLRSQYESIVVVGVVVVAYSHSQQIYICFFCFGSTNNKFFQFCQSFLPVAMFVKEHIPCAETSASECFRRKEQIVYISFENVSALFFFFFFLSGFSSQALTIHGTAREGREPSFIPLYHFHPLSSIETFICNFACETTITYF